MDPITKAIEANLHDYLDEFGKVSDGELFRHKTYRATYTGSPLLNRIYKVSFAAVDEITFQQVLRPYRVRNVPVTWMTSPSDSPQDAGDWLLGHGFKHLGHWVGMSLNIEDLPNVEAPNHFVCRPLKDQQDLDQWVKIAQPAFGLPAKFSRNFSELFIQLLTVPNAPFVGFLGCVNEQAVGACLLYEQSDVVGVYWVATAPNARRRGVASALTASVLKQISHSKAAVLHATASGVGVYKGMGFKEHCKFVLYGWAPIGQ